MQRQSIDIPNKLYDQIIQLKKNKSVEQFLSDLIGRYSKDLPKDNKGRTVIIKHSEVLSVKEKFDHINQDQNLSKFRFNNN